MQQAMIKRIAFGSGMTAAVLAVVGLEYFLSHRTGVPAETNRLWLGLPALLVLAALATVAFGELDTLAKSVGTRLLWPAGLFGTLVLLAWPKLSPLLKQALLARTGSSGWHSAGWFEDAPLLLIGLIVSGTFLNEMLSRRVEGALPRLAATLLAAGYLGAGGATMLAIRLQFGLGAFLLFLAAVKLTDVGAYFIGSLWGKHKLVPWLSPGKSWEGLIGGLATAAAVGWAFRQAAEYFDWTTFPFSLGESLFFCLLLGLAGQFGDLCESLLKRSAGVKDAGHLVPQFGGVLDILDSPLLAAPVGYALLILLGQPG